MAASPSQVVEALKQTPKGQLPYTSPLNNLPSSELSAYFKSLSTTPELTPVIVLDYIHRNTTVTPPSSPPVPLSCSPSSSPSSSNNNVSDGSPLLMVHTTITTDNDDDVLTANEYKQLEVSIQKHVDKYSRTKQNIELTHDIRMTEISHETETKRHEHKLERLQEEHVIRREVEAEMRMYTMTRQQHSEAVRKRIEENREIMRQREEEIRRERKELFLALEKDVLALNEKVRRIMETCRYGDLLDATPIHGFATHCNELIKIIVEQKESTDPNPVLLESCRVLVTQLLPLVTVIKDNIDTANKNGDEIIKKQQEEEQKKKKEQPTTLPSTTTGTSTNTTGISTNTTGTVTSTNTTGTVTSTNTTVTSTNTTGISTNIALPPALQEYEQLNKKLLEAVKLSSEFTSNTQYKKYRYSLQSAVAYMVGSISADNGGRLLSLVKQIQQLLGGQTIEVLEKRVSINDHTLARNFCLHLLVKKMVERVTEAPRNAFPVAGVVLLLWRNLSEFGQLFLAQCYQVCPLLAPITTQKPNDLSDVDFKR